jgi:uncharacterized protein YcfJ
MHQSFRDGFEKVAYDYNWEVEDMTHERMKRQYDAPIHKGKATGIGAGIGGVLGGAIGGIAGKSWKHGLIGGAAGLGLGALGGYATAKHDESDIEDARSVMAMEPDQRRSLLASRAHKQENDEREARADSRAAIYGNYN